MYGPGSQDQYPAFKEGSALNSDRYLAIVAVFLALILPGHAEPPGNEVLKGRASVIDGDTIEIHGERIRLAGFDTPESGARCGTVNVYQKAAITLSDLISGQTVTCNISGKDSFNRKTGFCAAGGRDLGAHMVATGWGRDWPRYSNGLYANEENRAREAGSGIWGLDCPTDLWGGRSYE